MNALTTELGQAMGNILATTPPDGKRQGRPAWFLTTAPAAIDEYNRPQTGSGLEGPDAILEQFPTASQTARKSAAVPAPNGPSKPQQEHCRSVNTVLIWLRSGMPYAREGDWAAGAGFILVPSLVIDWQAKLTVLNKLLGKRTTAHQLALDEPQTKVQPAAQGFGPSGRNIERPHMDARQIRFGI